jgi:hypothetical protein
VPVGYEPGFGRQPEFPKLPSFRPSRLRTSIPLHIHRAKRLPSKPHEGFLFSVNLVQLGFGDEYWENYHDSLCDAVRARATSGSAMEELQLKF